MSDTLKRATPGPALTAVVLAAGVGTRMHSQRPKPLHRLCGRPMVLHVLDAVAGIHPGRAVVVVGHDGHRVAKTISEAPPAGLHIDFIEQEVQRGTGDAVLVALAAFGDRARDDRDFGPGGPDDPDDPDGDPQGGLGGPDYPGGPDYLGDHYEDDYDGGYQDDYDGGDVIVLPGDTPLLLPETLAALVAAHREAGAAATLLTARLADPTGYGRVVRSRDGRVARVVEQTDATEEELAVEEVNTSIYVFRRSVVAPALRRLSPDNAQGEYYLTDVVAVLHDAGYPVTSMVVDDPREVVGVNDRAQLAAAEEELRRRVNGAWMRRGVTMLDPNRCYLDVTVQLAPDVTVYPGAILQGLTTVAAGAEIGPGTHLCDCDVGAGARVAQTVGRGAVIGAGAVVGPWAYLGPGSALAPAAVTGPYFSAGADGTAQRP